VSKRILIVDDSPVLLEAGRLTLEDAGYEVRTLDNPLMLAATLRREPCDLVLLDVNMPTVRWTQVILYSDLDEPTLKKRAEECGANGWLRKSGDEDKFVAAIQSWIGSAQ
jgi:DNA-binding response OmpR family regulator